MKTLALPSFAFIALVIFSGCSTLDPNDRDTLAQHHVPPSLYNQMVRQQPLALADIIELSKCHLSSEFIIHYINVSKTACHLSTRDVEFLKKSGVSTEVIDHMLNSGQYYAGRPSDYDDYPYYGPYPYYPYGYYYGGPVIVVGGYGYHHWH